MEIFARPARHPVYRHRIYWAEIHKDGRVLFGKGPYRQRRDAINAADEERRRRAMITNLDRRQLDLPETAPDPAGLAKRLASEPLRASKPQAACDVGLFSDAAAQVDLEDLLR